MPGCAQIVDDGKENGLCRSSRNVFTLGSVCQLFFIIYIVIQKTGKVHRCLFVKECERKVANRGPTSLHQNGDLAARLKEV